MYSCLQFCHPGQATNPNLGGMKISSKDGSKVSTLIIIIITGLSVGVQSNDWSGAPNQSLIATLGLLYTYWYRKDVPAVCVPYQAIEPV